MNRRPITREELLTPNWLLRLDGFPLPKVGQIAEEGYHFTKETYCRPNFWSPMFAIDCEMCCTEEGLELTKVAVVDERHVPMLETFVKPDNPIVDYLTEYSGVTADLLEGVTTRLQDVQESIKKFLPDDAILVGHALMNDLKVLKLYHPFIIDTSIVYRTRNNRKRKLRDLVAEHLGKKIQSGNGGHCPLEDSSAALKLIQLRLRQPPPSNGIYESFRATPEMIAAGNLKYFEIEKLPTIQHLHRNSEEVQETTDRNYVRRYGGLWESGNNNTRNVTDAKVQTIHNVTIVPVLHYTDDYGVKHRHRSTEIYFQVQKPPNIIRLNRNMSLRKGGISS